MTGKQEIIYESLLVTVIILCIAINMHTCRFTCKQRLANISGCVCGYRNVEYDNYFADGRGARYCDERVCMSVCLSVCMHVYLCFRWRILRTARPNFTKFSIRVIRGRGSHS